MKKLLLALMIPLVLTGCKKDDPEPEPEIAALVSTWKQTAYEDTVDGEKIWVPVDGESGFMTFRFDGVILDSKGLPACCAPDAYYLNGVLFEVIPKVAVPHNAQCDLVDCIGCATWNFELTENELILSYCHPLTSRAKYVRVKLL